MCGIVGYSGKRSAADFLINGLKKLEYRGYDSAGIAVNCGGKIVTVKAEGRMENLERKLAQAALPEAFCGIGHTRWATHGEPSDINSHPHSAGRVTLVHNGIIENYAKRKQHLEEKGRVFVSQTDTEVIAQLLDYYYADNPVEAIQKTLTKLRGSYALAILFSDRPDTIYAVRKDSPLVIGKGKDEICIASDIPAFLSVTKDYYLLEEGEIAIVRNGDVRFLDEWGNETVKQLNTATWNFEEAEKCGYKHFMLKEMHEEPKSLKNTIYPRIADGIDHILEKELASTESIRRLYIVGCGSAMHAGLLGKSAIESLAHIPCSVEIASEFRYGTPLFADGDAVVLISQSGETADSLAVLKLAREKGVPVIAIVNVVGSSIARGADIVLYTNAGPEIAVATTKAYTAQVAVLYMMALRLGIDRKTVSRERAEQIFEALKQLPEKAEEVLANETEYQRMATTYRNSHDLFFIGRGQDWAICCEGSLKLKEISYMHSEAYAAGELKHGTISLIEEGVPVIAISTTAALREKTISNLKEVLARGAHVIYECPASAVPEQKFYHDIIVLPDIDESVMPILAIIPLQMIAYYTAVDRGSDVDKPRNLAKSVTVE
ncbi:MAG: glutamine--fructose-6-phosphate transaminase (isomerizing) [Eubacteriales bacterium]|nr:glutamine--fructose-6-phosphate transaminase (isomerizing) [Eubacteriales bacterium]